MNPCDDDAITLGQSDANFFESGGNRVYLDFYGLNESPFSITPDPEFLFFSNTHKSVIDKILYGINSRMGFILLIGEVGTGKTTICRSILDSLKSNAEMVYIINPSISGRDVISYILDDLGVNYPSDSSKKELIDHLNHFLLSVEDNRPVVIIIDDAQTMSVDALEDLRLLSNLETDKEKLVQIVLAGQPELLELLGRREIRQLRQRVSITCHLEFLGKEEVNGYIGRRLFIAGDRGRVRFTRKAINRIFVASGGIPRLINKICDYALTAGYIVDDSVIGPGHIKKALKELGDLDFTRGFSCIIKPNRMNLGAKKWMFFSASGLVILIMILFSGQLIDPGIIKNKAYYAEVDTSIKNITEENAEVKDLTVPAEIGVCLDSKPKENPDVAGPEPYPYILLLASYKNLFHTLRAAKSYASQGIEAHWNKVDLEEGVWYRLFTGGYRTKEEARRYKKKYAFDEAMILSMPWTVCVGQYYSIHGLEEIKLRLKDNHYDSYTQKCGEGDGLRLLIGAFRTQEGAEKLAQEMIRLDLDAKVVLR